MQQLRVIAENLNSATSVVHAALAAGDRAWVESRARRIAESGVDAVDLCAATMAGAESEVLGWLAEIVEVATGLGLSLDSADPAVLARVGGRRRDPVILNSLACDRLTSEAALPLLDLVRDHGASLVVQLRQGAHLPSGHADREAWTENVLAAWERCELPLDRLLVDPVLLPWGPDATAGAGLLRFLEACSARWGGVSTIVGLSNVSYQHPDRRSLHRRWLPLLREAGLGAVILDALDPGLVALARS